MSYASFKAGVIEALDRLQAAKHLNAVLRAPPQTIQTTPLAWTAYNGFSRKQFGTVNRKRWRMKVYIAVPWQDLVTADTQLEALVDLVPDAIETAWPGQPGVTRNLGGAVNLVEVTEGGGEGESYMTFGEGESAKTYRVLALYVEAIDKS